VYIGEQVMHASKVQPATRRITVGQVCAVVFSSISGSRDGDLTVNVSSMPRASSCAKRAASGLSQERKPASRNAFGGEVVHDKQNEPSGMPSLTDSDGSHVC
jgi:hypothetical protein